MARCKTTGDRRTKKRSAAKTFQPWVRLAVLHWSRIVHESDIGCDWIDAHERCWRCGCVRTLQKCHIVARQFGGGDGPENIVALCAECHDEAPDVTDPEEVWNWIRQTRPRFYDSLKFERAIALCQARGVDVSRFNQATFSRLMMDCVGLHLMQTGAGCRIKPSSIAWAIEKACTEATNG